MIRFDGVPERNSDAEGIWIDHDADEVTVYRMDTREPVDSESDAFALGPDESVTLGLLVEAGEPGVVLDTVTVRAGIPTSTESSAGTPDFGVRASLSEAAVEPGETVVVHATLYNGGDARGTFEPTLIVDSEPVAEASTPLAVDEERRRTFEVTFEEPGEYELRLANTTVGTVTVGDGGPAGVGEPGETTPTATPDPTTGATLTPAAGEVAAEVVEEEAEGLSPGLVAVLLALTAVGYGLYRLRS